jgi:hypothetical protein
MFLHLSKLFMTCCGVVIFAIIVPVDYYIWAVAAGLCLIIGAD